MKKLKLNKYAFMSFFSGDFFTWVKQNDNFKELAEKYPEEVKKFDDFRYATLIEGKTNEELEEIMPSGITDGNIFGDEIIERFRTVIESEDEESASGDSYVKDYNDEVNTFNIWKEKITRDNPGIEILDLSYDPNDDVRKNYLNPEIIIPMTNELIASGKDFIAFEPAFIYKTETGREFITRVDVLTRINGVVQLIELKASTNAKLLHALDIFYQYKILNGVHGENFLKPENCFLGLINRNFRLGEEGELLFKYDSVFKFAKSVKWNPESDNYATNTAAEKDGVEKLYPSIEQVKMEKGYGQKRIESIISEFDFYIDFDYVLEKIAAVQEAKFEDVITFKSYEEDHRYSKKYKKPDFHWMFTENKAGERRYKTINLRLVDKDMLEELYIAILTKDADFMTVFDITGDSGYSYQVKFDLWMRGIKKASDLPEQNKISSSALGKVIRQIKAEGKLYELESVSTYIDEYLKGNENVAIGKMIKDAFETGELSRLYTEQVKFGTFKYSPEIDDKERAIKKIEQIIWDQDKKIIVRENRIDRMLEAYKGVIYMYDFETYTQAVPTQPKQAPYEQMPFQYSIHAINGELNMKDGEGYEEAEYLAKDIEDLGVKFWENFIEDMYKFHNDGEDATWVSWNMSFEKMVIRNEIKKQRLSKIQIDKLNKIIDETVDMMDFVRKERAYYHYNFSGSASIKFATEAFSPLRYKKQLPEVNNGLLASLNAKRWINKPEEKKEWWLSKRTDMLKYCWYDTLSMVYIYDGLSRHIKESDLTEADIPVYVEKVI